MKFYYEGLQNATLSYNGTADTDYPETNLQDMDKNTSFKDTTAVGGNELSIDFGSVKACDYVALVNYTATTEGDEVGLSLYSSANNSDWDEVFTAETITSATRTNHVKTFTSVTKRYWKLKFYDKGAASASVLDIPVILIGSVFEPANNPDLGYSFEKGYAVNTIQGAGGVRYASLTHSNENKVTTMDFNYINETDKAKWATLAETIKAADPYAAYPMLVYTLDSAYVYQRLMGALELKIIAYQAYSASIRLADEI